MKSSFISKMLMVATLLAGGVGGRAAAQAGGLSGTYVGKCGGMIDKLRFTSNNKVVVDYGTGTTWAGTYVIRGAQKDKTVKVIEVTMTPGNMFTFGVASNGCLVGSGQVLCKVGTEVGCKSPS